MVVASVSGMARCGLLWVWLLLACVSGCSSVSERLAGWYVTRKLDSYLDLTSAQKGRARVRVEETLTLLRRSELPHAITLLREVRQAIHDGLTDDSLARLQRRYDAQLDAGVALLAPRLAPLLAELDGEQLDHFAARMREDVEQQYEELKAPKAERSQAIEQRALTFLTDLVGDLSEAQEQTVRMMVRNAPDEREKQHRLALDNIAGFRAFMAQRPDATAIDQKLQTMWATRYDGLGPGRDKRSRRGQQRRWLLGVYQLLTVEQRAHAERVLSERIVMLKRWLLT